MINLVIARLALWAHAVPAVLWASGVAATAAVVVCVTRGAALWLTLIVTGVTWVITAEVGRWRSSAISDTPLDPLVERDIAASLTDESLRLAVTAWQRRYL